jgi:hypothetical protein
MHILDTTTPDGRLLTLFGCQPIAPELRARSPFSEPVSLKDAA